MLFVKHKKRQETNKKLRCPLKAKNRATTGIMYETGDKVYYKQRDSE